MGEAKKYGNAADLAALLGVSKPRVTALIKRGALGGVAKKIRGQYRIDLESAVTKIRGNIDQSQPAAKIKADSGSGRMPATGGIDYVTARALNEQYKAAVKKLDYEERIGKLINADKVREAAFDTARQVRDALMNIPDRVAAILAAEQDETKVRLILAREIRDVLQGLVSEA